jgi:hypothetical protein
VTAGAWTEPLVAVVCRVPLLSEALAAALEGIACVRTFPAGRGDTAGLLRALAPDAVVVDSESEAHQAAAFARETHSPLLHVSLRDQTLRTFADGRWRQVEEDPSPEAIRNAVVGGIFGQGRTK